MRKNTLDALKESISGSARIKNILLDNFKTKERVGIRLNLIYLAYDFPLRKMLLQYYVEDDDYPDVEMGFDDFINFIGGCSTPKML